VTVSRRARWAVIGMIAAVAVAVALLLALRSSPSAVDRAIDELRANDHYASSPEAGASLARISESLLKDGRSCSRDAGDDDTRRTRCDRRLAAAGWSSAAAVATLSCTQPGTQKIRHSLLDHLVAVRRAERTGSTARPELPQIPVC
jgi:hypothetical protein